MFFFLFHIVKEKEDGYYEKYLYSIAAAASAAGRRKSIEFDPPDDDPDETPFDAPLDDALLT